MFEDIVDTVIGPWGLAAVLLLGTNGGRRLMRGAFKTTVKAGMVVSDKAKDVAADMKDMTNDLKNRASNVVDEARAEQATRPS